MLSNQRARNTWYLVASSNPTASNTTKQPLSKTKGRRKQTQSMMKINANLPYSGDGGGKKAYGEIQSKNTAFGGGGEGGRMHSLLALVI